MNGWIRSGRKTATHNRFVVPQPGRLRVAIMAAVALLAMLAVEHVAVAQEAQWIWSPEHSKEAVPTGEACHFRKSFTVRAPEGGQIAIAADDQYEIYLNGRRIGTGEATKKLDEYDISRYLTRGNNGKSSAENLKRAS